MQQRQTVLVIEEHVEEVIQDLLWPALLLDDQRQGLSFPRSCSGGGLFLR